MNAMNGIRVLIVDDEESFSKPLAQWLQSRFGYAVDTARTGKAGLSLVRRAEGDYDVVLVDQRLIPGPDGIQIMKAMKEKFPGLQVVILTGWGDTESGLKAMQEGAFRYLSKPFDHEELALLIRSMAEFRGLIRVSQAVNSSLDLDHILQAIFKETRRLIPIDAFYIALYDPAKDELHFEFVFDKGQRVANFIRKLAEDSGLTGWIVKNEKPLFFSNLPEEEHKLPVPSRTEGDPASSWVGLPLIVREKVIGVISIQSYEPYAFDQGHRRLLTAIASQVASAIENARLFSALSEGKEWREALIESALDAVIAIDREMKVTVFNRRAEEMFGWTAEEMTGHSVARLHMDIAKAREIHRSVEQNEMISGWELDLKHKDGTPIPALLSATLVHDTQGQSVGQAGFMRDQRETRLFEDRLRALIRVGRAISGTLELDRLLQLVVDSAVGAFPSAEKGSIHLYDERTDMLHIRASHGYSPHVIEALTLKVGEGFAGCVYKEATPIVSDNVQADARFKKVDHPEVQAQKSSICVPLTARDKVIGTLTLDNTTAFGAFRPDDAELLSTFAAQAAIAIDNARRMQEMERMRRAAEVVARVMALGDLKATLDSVVEGTRDAVGCDAVVLYVYDQAIGKLNHPPTMLDVRYPDRASRYEEVKADSIVYKMLAQDKPYIVERITEDPGFGGTRFARDEEIESCVAIPLTTAEQKVGVMFVNYRSRHLFTADDLANIEHFANQAAVAIQNAQLYQTAQRHVETLQAIQNTSAAVSATLDVETLLPLITEEAAVIFAAPASSLMLWDEQQEYLTVRAAAGLTQKYVQGQRIPRKKVQALARNGGVGPQVFDIHSQPIGEAALVHEEGLHSALVAPLLAGDELIGILCVYSKDAPRTFHERDKELASVFANHATIAIQNAQLYEQLEWEVEQRALIDRVTAEISSTLDLDKILQTLVNELAQAVGVEQCAIAIFDEAGEYGDIVAEYLGNGCVPSKGVFRIPLRGNPTVDRVRHTHKPVAVRDAQSDPLMEAVWDVMKQRKTKSIMVVPMVIGEDVIGTIGLDSVAKHRNFTAKDMWLAGRIAYHAAIAIHNAKQYDELKRVKGMVGARTALAWMGMASSAWRHSIEGHAINIRNAITLLRQELQAPCLDLTSRESMESKFDLIERLATQVLNKPITPPLSSEEGIEVIVVNDLISERIGQLWENQPYQAVTRILDLEPEANVGVSVSPEWVRRALDILVDNAVEAMIDSPERQLGIATRLVRDRVEIAINDTGKGIPPDVYPKLFKERIDRLEGGETLGMGLLMVQAIMETYGGDVRVENTGAHGTTVAISLPVAQRDSVSRDYD